MKRRRAKRSAAAAKKGRFPAADTLALGQLDNHLGYFVRRLQIWIFQDFIRTLAPMKVRPAQYSVLLIVEANPGRTQASVGQKLGIERARLARLLHELERRKWVARHANGSDARSHSLYLTVEGEKALVKIKQLAEQHELNLRALLGQKRHRQSLDWLRDFA
ncbi:MAG TPA: MarR family winged helix-turn-helix transcriptional regulator [Pseudolabrys sp.]|nr:MarR family winged helix-turn-helix transcriptional regulator [Pseudolabrys sp.]